MGERSALSHPIREAGRSGPLLLARLSDGDPADDGTGRHRHHSEIAPARQGVQVRLEGVADVVPIVNVL